MRGDLILPVAMLAVVLIATPFVLFSDGRNKRLEQRLLDITGPRSINEPATPAQRDIRLVQSRDRLFKGLPQKILRIPDDIPLAHKLPVWLVLVLGIIVGVAVTLFASNFIGPGGGSAIGALAGFGFTRSFFGWECNSYRDKLLDQLPDTLELIMSATRAGLPLAESFRGVMREMPDPTREEFRRLLNEAALGVPMEEALMRVNERSKLMEYAIFSATVGVQSRSGGRISESLQNLSETVRQRVTMKGRAQALSAEARLSARIMSALPFAGGGMMSMMNPGYLAPLFTDPAGKKMFMIGVTMLVIGMYMMNRLIKSVTNE